MKGPNLLKRYCLDSSVLGLKYFYLYPDKVSRCFWALITILVWCFAGVLVYGLYRRFLMMPTRITIENQFEPVADLSYPAITVCSPNQITISSMRHFNRTLVDGNRTTIQLARFLPQLLGFHNVMHVDKAALTHLQSLIDLNRYQIPEVMTTLPQSCDSFLKLCYLHQKRYPGCKGLFKPILTYHGLCCIFNSIYSFQHGRRNDADPSVSLHKVLQASVQQGLTVVTDYEPHDALDGSMIFAGSTKVMFNDWNEFPSDDELSLVQPYTESFHSIHATYTYCSDDVKTLPPASRKCYFENENPLQFFNRYRNSDCDQMCFIQAVESTCKCLLIYLPRLRLQHACNITSIQCIIDVKVGLHQWSRAANCDCPRDCESRHYKVHMTVGNLNALPYMTKDIYGKIVFNRSTSIMHFFFPTPSYETQKQETVLSITTLASNMGGVFGLCLGCSVVSVVEMMFYVYSSARNCARAARKGGQARRRVAFYN